MAMNNQKKYTHVFWMILLSWIFVFGTICTGSTCKGDGDGFRHPTGGAQSGAKDYGSTCRKFFQPFSVAVFTGPGHTADVCCNNKIKNCQRKHAGNVQNGYAQKPISSVSALPDPVKKDFRSNAVFKQHKINPTVSIYTITQSFLC